MNHPQSNYVWPHQANKAVCIRSKAPKTIDPIYQYGHETGPVSVTGGYVYRGKAFPSLAGWYFFADYVDGRIFGLKYEGGKINNVGVVFTPRPSRRQRG